jgi:hypothetical protein
MTMNTTSIQIWDSKNLLRRPKEEYSLLKGIVDLRKEEGKLL